MDFSFVINYLVNLLSYYFSIEISFYGFTFNVLSLFIFVFLIGLFIRFVRGLM